MMKLATAIWADARTASRDRWVLAALVFGATLLATAIAEIRHPGINLALFLFALLAIIQPAGNAVMGIFIVVIARFAVINDDPTSVETLMLALALLVLHLAVALMGSTPHSADLTPRVRRRWAVRGLTVAASTLAMWVAANLLTRLESPGRTVLTVAALLVVGAGALTVRHRATD